MGSALKVRVLFDCPVPFSFAHGGQQIQIQQTQAALQKIGVAVEPLRWWDEHQTGEIFHYFGRAPSFLLQFARRKGMKIVSSALEGGLGAKPAIYRFLLRSARQVLRKTTPGLGRVLGWEAFRLSDASIALTAWEAHLLKEMFQADPATVHTIPNGVEDAFLNSLPAERGPWLICTATIIELKQVLKVAQAAVLAKTPVWVIGRPYSEADAYFQRFISFARQNKKFVRYEGPIVDREQLAGIYRQSRGFVLLSKWESLSLSTLEAAACECPLLLSELPWAKWHFQQQATFCPVGISAEGLVGRLRNFYDRAPELPIPAKPLSWTAVAQKLNEVYQSLLTEREPQ